MPQTPASRERRWKAQRAFVDLLGKEDVEFRTSSLLVAKYMSLFLTSEVASLSGQSEGKSPGGYSMNDHMERIRYISLSGFDEAYNATLEIVESAVPGTREFLTSERFNILLGKMVFNTIGICYGGGRDDKASISSAMKS